MVYGRLIPTTFFRDPDVMSLSSGDVRLILVGLVLHADDYGRGMAHPDIVGRDLDYPPAAIEAAFAELEQVELVQCYQVGRHRYYVVTRWSDWQKLHKPTPSRYPAPPARTDEPGADFPGCSETSPENPGKSGKRSPESESESESKGNRIEVEEEAAPPNVVPFPATRDDDDAVSSRSDVSEPLQEATQQVAAILHLPASEGLARIVAEYQEAPGLSLVGEADAAREWVDDPMRNRKGQRMSLAFFRRWLQREVEAADMRKHSRASLGTASASTRWREKRTGTTGSGPPGDSTQAGDDPYTAFVNRRAAEVRQHWQEGKKTHEATS
jgi:hypothetical protein